MMITQILVFLYLFIYFNVNNYEINKTEIIECNPQRSVNISLENGYYKNVNQYEEGVIVTFTYADSSYVLVLCG